MTDCIDEGWEDVFCAYGTGALPFRQIDIECPIAAVVTQGDYAETEVWAIFRLKDGRYAYVEGCCDTTGWDCRSNCSGAVADSLEALTPHITDEGCVRLGVRRSE